MSKTPISRSLGRRVASESRYRCGYCLCSESFGVPMEFDHLIPESRGGRTIQSNLWLACGRCNGFKANRTRSRDPWTRRIVRIFNPRHDEWAKHFRWVDGGLRIDGLTGIGRATVAALRLNLQAHVLARRLWIIAGVHPPLE